VAAAAAAVHELTSLPAEHSQHEEIVDVLDQIKQTSNRLSAALGLAGQLRGNFPTKGDPTKLGYRRKWENQAMKVLWYMWEKWLAGLYGRSQDELEHLMRRHEPR
jgi:hypothetical protein